MSLFLPFKRATLLIPSGPSHDIDRKHLFILLTDPYPNPDSGAKSVLMVSLSTLNNNMQDDRTCILYPGDHPFVKVASFVSYRQAKITDADALMRGVAGGKLVQRDMLDEAIFARVCYGLTQSRHTAPAILRFYEAATVPPKAG